MMGDWLIMVKNNVQEKAPQFDLKQTVTENRLLGLWRMLTGYQLLFVGAITSIGLAAVFQTGFYSPAALLHG